VNNVFLYWSFQGIKHKLRHLRIIGKSLLRKYLKNCENFKNRPYVFPSAYKELKELIKGQPFWQVMSLWCFILHKKSPKFTQLYSNSDRNNAKIPSAPTVAHNNFAKKSSFTFPTPFDDLEISILYEPKQQFYVCNILWFGKIIAISTFFLSFTWFNKI
jgi:hypothetical protein